MPLYAVLFSLVAFHLPLQRRRVILLFIIVSSGPRRVSDHCCFCLITKWCPIFFVTPRTAACQAPLSMGFSRQDYWIVLPFPSPENLLDPGIKLMSPTLIGRRVLHPCAICSLYLWIFISPSLSLEPSQRQKRRGGKFLAFSSSKFGIFLINCDHPILSSLSPIFTDLVPVSLKWTNSRDVLGGPVVETLNFQFRGHGFNSWLGK